MLSSKKRKKKDARAQWLQLPSLQPRQNSQAPLLDSRRCEPAEMDVHQRHSILHHSRRRKLSDLAWERSCTIRGRELVGSLAVEWFVSGRM